MILWPKSRRSVSSQVARQITSLVKNRPKDQEGFPKVVGIFVDEDADQIEKMKRETCIDMLQLHGNNARDALPDLDPAIPKIYVLHVDDKGLRRR